MVFRKIKHQIFLFKKIKLPIIKNKSYPKIFRNYTYSKENYQMQIGPVTIPSSSTFLINHLLFSEKFNTENPIRNAPGQIFLIWFGGNLSENRIKGIHKIKESNPSLRINVITEKNLNEFILDDHPLHISFDDLSHVHKSDYIRAYLMNFHGGVYCDIKSLDIDWKFLIDELNLSDDWAIGPSERDYQNVSAAPGNGKLGKDQQHFYYKTLYPASYVCKPRTAFTYSQLAEIERRLDYFQKLLHENPAIQPWGHNENYPVPWNALHGQIWSPLNLKYIDKIKTYSNILNDFGNHR